MPYIYLGFYNTPETSKFWLLSRSCRLNMWSTIVHRISPNLLQEVFSVNSVPYLLEFVFGRKTIDIFPVSSFFARVVCVLSVIDSLPTRKSIRREIERKRERLVIRRSNLLWHSGTNNIFCLLLSFCCWSSEARLQFGICKVKTVLYSSFLFILCQAGQCSAWCLTFSRPGSKTSLNS